jgi:hypothetical protein
MAKPLFNQQDVVSTLSKPMWNRLDPRQMPMASRPRYPPAEPIAVGEDAYKGGYATHQIIDGKAYPFWEAHLHLMQNSYARAYDQFWGPNGFGAMPDVIQHVAGWAPILTFTCCL